MLEKIYPSAANWNLVLNQQIFSICEQLGLLSYCSNNRIMLMCLKSKQILKILTPPMKDRAQSCCILQQNDTTYIAVAYSNLVIFIIRENEVQTKQFQFQANCIVQKDQNFVCSSCEGIYMINLNNFTLQKFDFNSCTLDICIHQYKYLGTRNGQLYKLSLKNQQFKFIAQAKRSPIQSIDQIQNQLMFTTGNIVNIYQRKLQQIKVKCENRQKHKILLALFLDQNNILISTYSGQLKLLDLTTKEVKNILQQVHYKAIMKLQRYQDKILSISTDYQICEWVVEQEVNISHVTHVKKMDLNIRPV